MKSTMSKAVAVLEVVVVRFVFIPLLYWGITKLVPQLEEWQVSTLRLPFPVLNHTLMVVIPILIIAMTRKDFRSYGISFKNIKYHVSIMGICFVPFVIASLPFGMGLDYKSWSGAILLAGIQIGLLLVLGWLLKGQPSKGSLNVVVGGWMVLAVGQVSMAGTVVEEAIATFVTYAVFVGFGEEIIFRGYIQSRLNEAFGCPYSFFGVQYGWGVVIASFLFGLTHVGLLTMLLGQSSSITWAWGLWTFFGGLVFGFVREKSGSIVAPALLHGLPQAIASVVILFL
jgi:membrane protease YdiL (CAAX protease family)